MSTLIGPIENENEYAAKKRRRKQETSRLAKKAKRSRPANYIDYNAAVSFNVCQPWPIGDFCQQLFFSRN